jgi:hypothetical protein
MTISELCYTDVAESKPIPAAPEATDLLGSFSSSTPVSGKFGLMSTV